VSGRAHDDHYSYTLYADPETARTFDDRRFGGPIGSLVASGQARTVTDFIGRIQGRTILDVGTGTGRGALFLAAGGAKVTGVDASEQMLSVARRRAAEDHLQVAFKVGDAHALEFPDRSFEVAISLRVLMHTPEWRTCIAELCRVSSQLVVLDYPSKQSVAALQSAWRKMRAHMGASTEPYRVFSDADITDALQAGGFRLRTVNRQFVLPIAFHKAIGSRRFTLAIESALDRLGLRRRFGSPVTIVAERCPTP
jgi:SAM-dependent methyltransferase